ncbi:MAG: hypothetical protein GC193_03940 [Cryomorphaceae bacterium]|nr:hypothetical protein [Cryomorphaceae bacterium]
MKTVQKTILLICLLCNYSLEGISQADTLGVPTKFFYENGVLSSEGPMINGLPDGFWKTYYEDGNLKTAGNRKNHLLEGEWFFNRPDGTLERIITYSADKRNGYTKEFSADSIVIAQIPYEGDIRSGLATYFYETGERYRETTFVNNKEEGKGYEYDKDGRVITNLTYQNGFLRSIEKINRYQDGQRTGYWIDLYPNGVKKEEGNYRYGLRNGVFKFYNKKGDLDKMEQYVDGELMKDSELAVILDIRKEYYPDGRLKLVGSYNEGSKQGVFREYNEEGVLSNGYLYEENLKIGEGVIDPEGKYQGPWKLFYPTGELRAEGSYVDGLREGPWKFYFTNGKVEQLGNYKTGNAHGGWKWFFQNGSVKREESFRKGKEDGEFFEYDEDGIIIHQGSYIDGLKTGPWIYHVNDHKEVGEFLDGEKNGKWNFYVEDKEVIFTGEYLVGIPVGKHKYFYPNGRIKLEGKYEGGVRDGDWKYFNEDGTLAVAVKYNNGVMAKIDGVKLPKELEE